METVDSPDWLAPEARQEWDRVVPGLLSLGLFRPGPDRATLAWYCCAWATMLEAEKELRYKREGTERRALTSIAKDSRKAAESAAFALGMAGAGPVILPCTTCERLYFVRADRPGPRPPTALRPVESRAGRVIEGARVRRVAPTRGAGQVRGGAGARTSAGPTGRFASARSRAVTATGAAAPWGRTAGASVPTRVSTAGGSATAPTTGRGRRAAPLSSRLTTSPHKWQIHPSRIPRASARTPPSVVALTPPREIGIRWSREASSRVNRPWNIALAHALCNATRQVALRQFFETPTQERYP